MLAGNVPVMAVVDSTHPPGVPGVLFDVPAPLELVDNEWLARHPEPVDPELLPPDLDWAPAEISEVDLLAWAEAETSFGEAAWLLDRIDPAALSEADRVRLLAVCARIENQATALRLATIAAVAGPEPTCEQERLEDFSDCDVSTALAMSVNGTRCLIGWVRHLHAHLPLTCRLLGEGRLGYVQARIVAEATMGVDQSLLPRVEKLALTGQALTSPGRLRTAVTKAVARVDAAGHAEREKAARRCTDVYVSHEPDGIGTLYGANIPSLDLAVIDQGMEAFARSAKAQGDARTLGQLRAAAMVAWASGYLTGPGAPTSHGRPVTVQVTMGLDTLLGLSDQPAEVTGGGLIPAHVARAALRDATLRRLILDPVTGWLIDYGRSTYRVPAELAEQVNARYVTTTGPGSSAPARYGDQDHALSWAQGGTTSPDNLHPPGRRWHNAHTHGGWKPKICQCGTVTWHSAHGLTYRVEPHDYRLGP